MPAASRPSKSLRPSGIRPGHVCRGRHRPAHAERLSLPAIKAEPLLQPGRQGSPAALPVHGGCRRSPFAVPEGSLFLGRPKAAIGAARPSDTPKARRPLIPSNVTDRVRRPQLVGQGTNTAIRRREPFWRGARGRQGSKSGLRAALGPHSVLPGPQSCEPHERGLRPALEIRPYFVGEQPDLLKKVR
jgi:hypothetical protein